MSFEVSPDCIAPPAAHWAQELTPRVPLLRGQQSDEQKVGAQKTCGGCCSTACL